MRVTSAQLQHPARGEDRILATRDHVIMLGCASAYGPLRVLPARTFIGSAKRSSKRSRTTEPIRKTALAHAINRTAGELRLSPGRSPSSTVTIARERRDDISILVLRDNLVVLPALKIRDDRLASIAQRSVPPTGRDLASGAGYGPEH